MNDSVNDQFASETITQSFPFSISKKNMNSKDNI